MSVPLSELGVLAPPLWVQGGRHTRLGGRDLKVPKCEIFDRSDFHDFYTIKSL